MSYGSITNSTINAGTAYIDSFNESHKEMSVLKKNILIRGAYLILGPALIIPCALDIIIGLGVGMGAIGTVGKHEPILRLAGNHLKSSNFLLLLPYISILAAINVKPDMFDDNDPPPLISSGGFGFVSNRPIQFLLSAADRHKNSGDFIKRHVASRLTYSLLAISCLVTRAVDGIICVPAASLSILTFGKFVSLNNLALGTLQAPSIIRDLFLCTIGMINPWSVSSTEC